MKIYTKTGDKGLTSLFGGARISKDDIRIEAYGTVDELNSFVGSLHDNCPFIEIQEELFIIQNRLFNIGSVLATDPASDFNLTSVGVEDITFLERAIDEMDAKVPELKNFILPSGASVISTSHICRTVCRRAERRIISLQHTGEIDNNIIIYLNRLSDYFFLLSRYFAIKLNIEEIKWKA